MDGQVVPARTLGFTTLHFFCSIVFYNSTRGAKYVILIVKYFLFLKLFNCGGKTDAGDIFSDNDVLIYVPGKTDHNFSPNKHKTGN